LAFNYIDIVTVTNENTKGHNALPENMNVNPNKIPQENPFGIWIGAPY
jgi:hypothetical protein